jgi:hypothetical protein
MDRRKFLQLVGLGAGGIVLEQAIPFNRVWSFPKNIVVPNHKLDGVLGKSFSFETYLEVGDVVTFDKLPGIFTVSAIEARKVELWHGEKLLCRGAHARMVHPLLFTPSSPSKS